MPDLKTEIQRRRTFAIISHPDAGNNTAPDVTPSATGGNR